MARSTLVWAVVSAFIQWISLSVQLERCVDGGYDVEVVFEAEHPNITAPPDYFYKQLLQAQYDFFFLGQSSASNQEPYCWDGKSWMPMNIKNMPDTRLVKLDHNKYKVINETASTRRQIRVTNFVPFRHYRDVTETSKWREVLSGDLFATIYSWKDGAPDSGLIYSDDGPELTQERVLSIMSRCDACLEDLPKDPKRNASCTGCCQARPPNWYCGIGTVDELN